MISLQTQTQASRFYSVILVLVFLLPNLYIPFLPSPIGDNSMEIDEISNNSIDTAQLCHPGHTTDSSASVLASSSRSNNENESEPNDDITLAISSGNELHDTKIMHGEMRYSTDELDYYYIYLAGGGQNNIDRLNITPVFSDLAHIDNKSVGIKLKMYTEFASERFLLEYKVLGTNEAVLTDFSVPWTNATSLFVNADRTGRYYLEVAAVYIRDAGSGQIIHPNALINYSLHVTVTPTSNTDKNNDMNNGTALTSPKTDQRLRQGNDHWDWYTIDSLTENRAVNVSVVIGLTYADKTGYYNNSQHYVKFICVLKYFDLEQNQDTTLLYYGDWKAVYNPNPIKIYLNATFSKIYLGLHIQQRRWEDNDEVDMVGCGISNVKYNIPTIALKLVNTNPKLLQPSVTPTKGNQKNDYLFKIIYQDEDNDEPWYVNLVLEDEVYNMSLSSDAINDDDYTNGELYELKLAGTNFANIPHDKYKTITYGFQAIDYYTELSKPLSLVETLTFNDLSIINNIKPTLRTNLPEYWTLQEDSKPAYIKLFTIFSDPDKSIYPKEVTFEVWSAAYNWDSIMGTNNLTAEVMDNNTLKLTPKEHKFGSDTIPIRAYDNEGANTAVEYDLKTVINPINDRPILVQPPDYTGKDAMVEDEYCNITFVADDSADENVDLLIFSIDIFEKIPTLAEDPEKHKFRFSNYTGKLTFIPNNEMVGLYKINISVMDNGTVEPIGLIDTKQFDLEIKNVNDAPVARITHPLDGAKFNTSAEILLSAENTTDDDVKHGDILSYAWYIYYNGTDEEFLGKGSLETTTAQIKEVGYHVLKLVVRDYAGAMDETTIDLRIISLVGDIPGGDDSDDDGVPDLWELRYDLDPEKFDSDLDSDNDTFTNLEEYLGEDNVPGGEDSSNPLNPESIPGDLDADKLPDFWERQMFNTLLQSPTGDPDDDGYTNLQEYLGVDGLPGNDDWSDPLKGLSIPVGSKKKSKDDSMDLGTILIIASVVVIIIIILLISYLHITSKRKKAKEEEEKSKEKEKKAIYTPEPQPVPMMPPPAPGMPMQRPPVAPFPPPQGPMPVAQPMASMPMPMPVPMQPPHQGFQQPPQQQGQLGLPASGQVIKVDDKNKK
ncbi:hypothetical protein [[Eubacterium] cellulosolvens]